MPLQNRLFASGTPQFNLRPPEVPEETGKLGKGQLLLKRSGRLSQRRRVRGGRLNSGEGTVAERAERRTQKKPQPPNPSFRTRLCRDPESSRSCLLVIANRHPCDLSRRSLEGEDGSDLRHKLLTGMKGIQGIIKTPESAFVIQDTTLRLAPSKQTVCIRYPTIQPTTPGSS